MPKVVLRIIPALICWAVFIIVVLKVPYPESLTQANFNQVLPFFTTLFLSLIFSLNIFLRNFFISFSLSFSLILLLILKALDSLNIVTAGLVIIATLLLISYFKKVKRKNLSKLPKISKIKSL